MKKTTAIFLFAFLGSICFFPGCVNGTHKEIRQLMDEVESDCAYGADDAQEWMSRSWKSSEGTQLKVRFRPKSNWSEQTVLDYLKRLKMNLERGKAMTYRPDPVVLPKCETAPVLDGVLDDKTWETALTYTGSYRMDSMEKEEEESIWKICYDEQYIYFAASFKDSEIGINQKEPYWKDCLELFIYPDRRLNNYIELNIAPDGTLYSTWDVLNQYRQFDLVIQLLENYKGAAKITEDGYVIEGCIGFNELPGYLLGNPPQSGQTLSFMMVRTNFENGKKSTSNVPVPFLYDGHNVNGYIPAILE